MGLQERTRSKRQDELRHWSCKFLLCHRASLSLIQFSSIPEDRNTLRLTTFFWEGTNILKHTTEVRPKKEINS